MASKCVINNHGSSVGVNGLQYLIGILFLGIISAPLSATSNEQIPLFDDEYTVQKYAFYPISAMSSEEADEYVGKSQWFYHGTAGGALYKCDGGFKTSHKVITKAQVYSYDPVHSELSLNGNEFRLTTLKCGESRHTLDIVSTVDDSIVYYGLDGVLFKLVKMSGASEDERKENNVKVDYSEIAKRLNKIAVQGRVGSKKSTISSESKVDVSQNSPEVSSTNSKTSINSKRKNSKAASRSIEDIQVVFNRNKSAIDSLYVRALRNNPTLRGKLVLGLTIDPSGKITRIEQVSSELGDSALERKLLQRIKMFNFGAKQVGAVTLTYPIDFQPLSGSNDSEMKNTSKKRSSPIHDDEDTKILVDRAGKYYNKGEYRKAAKLYAEAAQMGDVKAQEMLGIMYTDGKGGLEKNHKAAIELYEKLAEQDGTATHQFMVGVMYHRGGPGLKKNMEKSLFWFRKAEPKIRKDAALGNVRAQSQLGSMYYEGFGGLKKSYTTSMYWYRKAAEQESKIAQFYVGLFYYFGEGVEKDYREATKWFRKAAEQGLADALNMLDRAEIRNVNKIEDKQELQRRIINEHVLYIRERIGRNWIRPSSTDFELSCAIEVQLRGNGEVKDVQVVRSSGVVAFDDSVIKAVHEASPLPMPTNPEASQRFRRLRFEFGPAQAGLTEREIRRKTKATWIEWVRDENKKLPIKLESVDVLGNTITLAKYSFRMNYHIVAHVSVDGPFSNLTLTRQAEIIRHWRGVAEAFLCDNIIDERIETLPNFVAAEDLAMYEKSFKNVMFGVIANYQPGTIVVNVDNGACK